MLVPESFEYLQIFMLPSDMLVDAVDALRKIRMDSRPPRVWALLSVYLSSGLLVSLSQNILKLRYWFNVLFLY